MKALVVALGVVVLAAAVPAVAQAPLDPRIREIAYQPGEVYRVAGAFRTATQIIFSPQETIRHAAIGDSVAWEVAAEGRRPPARPRTASSVSSCSGARSKVRAIWPGPPKAIPRCSQAR